ncbi:MAG TPA: NAD(P)H-dependent oxidoreductase subunit E [Bacteroidota bacterium]|nr:NAD(P)H-dependent oxidoreductase subunit E [Bacteroidota bacterium]
MDGTQTVSTELQEIDAVVARHEGHHGSLLSILEETQLLNEHKYLSEKALNAIASKTGVPLSRIYNVVTFYSFFNLVPQGKHTITVCRGTACHTKGSKALLDDLGLMLGCSKALEERETSVTTPDKQFTISTVACFGQCALAPVIAVDEVIYSSMTTGKLQKILAKVSRTGRKQP